MSKNEVRYSRYRKGTGTGTAHWDYDAVRREHFTRPMAAGDDPLLTAEPDEHATNKRKLLIGAAMCTGFMLTEIIGGWLAGSLAVMTDAAHMLSDVAGCVLPLKCSAAVLPAARVAAALRATRVAAALPAARVAATVR